MPGSTFLAILFFATLRQQLLACVCFIRFTPVSLLVEFATCSLPHNLIRYLS